MEYNGEDYIQFMKESQWKFVNTIAVSFGWTNKGSVIDEINNWFNYKIAKASASSSKQGTSESISYILMLQALRIATLSTVYYSAEENIL